MGGRCTVKTATVVGVEAVPVDVEVDVGAGLPSFSVVGLPDAAVVEARERVRSALRASGYEVPLARVVVNLAPGPLRKHGTGFDLPIALALLVATRQLAATLLEGVSAVGELSLDGSVRRVPGLVAHALTARANGSPLLGPVVTEGVAGLDGLRYLPLRSLNQLRRGLPDPITLDTRAAPAPVDVDFGEVAGQNLAIRALMIAAAGGHNIVLVGPPGSGKTMLARRLPTILPALERTEALESALIHSVAGLDASLSLAGRRPFRSPHHSASIAGLVGGGSPPRPGEASLAHHGVLFLDEMPEFGPAALQCLRQPMEDGRIVLVRADGRVCFPASFALVGAANPCPCGYLGDPARTCDCRPGDITRYRARIGGPLMDRIDLVVQVDRPDPATLLGHSDRETSQRLRERVSDARDRASGRAQGPTARLSGAGLLSACRLSAPSRRVLEIAARRHHLSGRGITRLLRVARTIADLEGAEHVEEGHLTEALSYRAMDRP